MGKQDWYKSTFDGIRYRKHPTRKHGIKFDQYIVGRFTVNGKTYQSAFGWQSEGWTEKDAFDRICRYKTNAKFGKTPTTIKEEYEIIKSEKAKIEQAEHPDQPDNITFGRFYDTYYKDIAQADKSDTTSGKESSYFNAWLLPELEDVRFRDITDNHLENIKTSMLNKGSAASSIKQCFNIFRSVWGYAFRRKIVSGECPAKYITLPKVDNKNERFFTYDEANRLLQNLKKKPIIETYHMSVISLHTGARRGEIFDIRWGDMNYGNGSMILRGKGSKTRHVYMTEEVVEIFQARFNDQKQGQRIFINQLGTKYSQIPDCFDTSIAKLDLNTGVEDRKFKASFHTWRHTFASWHVQNGTDLYEVCKMMGHSSISVTERYAHLRPDGLRATSQRYNQLLQQQLNSD
jgi:site-specific recombinase XerD